MKMEPLSAGFIKKETWIYSKNSFKNNEESTLYRIYRLAEGERVDVVVDWNEFPENMIKVVYYDKQGDKIIGYMVTSSLQFLEAR